MENLVQTRAGSLKNVWILFKIFVCLIIVGAVCEFVAEKYDEYRYSLPGKLIDIGGYRIHIHCSGQKNSNQPNKT